MTSSSHASEELSADLLGGRRRPAEQRHQIRRVRAFADLLLDGPDPEDSPLIADSGYLMSTSGTTGEPMLVLAPEAPLLRFLGWYRDRFGIGHGSVNALRRFRLRGLKLDAGLTSATDRETEALLPALFGLAASLALPVAATGVELVERGRFEVVGKV